MVIVFSSFPIFLKESAFSGPGLSVITLWNAWCTVCVLRVLMSGERGGLLTWIPTRTFVLSTYSTERHLCKCGPLYPEIQTWLVHKMAGDANEPLCQECSRPGLGLTCHKSHSLHTHPSSPPSWGVGFLGACCCKRLHQKIVLAIGMNSSSSMSVPNLTW